MKEIVRIHIVSCSSNHQLSSNRNDLFQFCRTLNIPIEKDLSLPGENSFVLDLQNKDEKVVFLWMKALSALEGLNSHFAFDIREVPL